MKQRIKTAPPVLRYNVSILFCLIAFFSLSCQGLEQSPRRKFDACVNCGKPKQFARSHGLGSSDQGKINFAHPLILSAEDWARILEAIHIKSENPALLFFSTKGAVTQAFSPDEIDYLSKVLSKAFAQIQPNKLVVFGLSKIRPQDQTEVTTGGWFAEGTHLHLLLANYKLPVAKPDVTELLWRDPLYNNAPQYYNLVPGEYQTLRTAGKLLGSAMKSDIPNLSIEYKSFLAKPAEKSSPMAAPAVNKQDTSIEQRLRTLQRLKENGLITEEDFLEKKKKLLENL